MKRSLLKIASLLLLCLLTVSLLSSCSFDFVNSWFNGDTEDGENKDNINQESIGDGSDEKNEDSQDEPLLNELDANSDVVLALNYFLKHRMMQADKGDTTIAYYIDEIKNGARPLLVDFAYSSCYFVCGYYSPACEYESLNYCCTDEYTWVEVEKAADIREFYKGQKILVAFQFNIASLVENLACEEDAPRFENFNMFETKFINGQNVNESDEYDKRWLYIDQSGKSNIYETSFPSAISGYDYKTGCIYLDGEYYLLFRLWDDQSYNQNYYSTTEFKNYYDDMMSIMIIDKYSIVNEDGSVTNYGLINVRDFVEIISGGEEI